MNTLNKSIKLLIEAAKAGTTFASAPVSFGLRAQSTAIPAICFTVDENKPLTLGANALCRARITVSFLAYNAEDVDSISEDFENNLPTEVHTYGGYSFSTAVNNYSVMQNPTPENGEEAALYESTTSIDLFYQRN